MNTEIPKIRPQVLSDSALAFLDKIRAFRHFIRHAYDCEFDPKALRSIQESIIQNYPLAKDNLQAFRAFVQHLSND